MRRKNTGRRAATLKILALTSTALVGLALPLSAQAQEWTGATNGSWFNAGNWNPGHVPTAADDVTIEAGPGSIPNISGPLQNGVANKIAVGDTNTDGSTATLNIEDGGTLASASGVIGNLAGSKGLVDVGSSIVSSAGSSALWNVSGALIIGNAGEGTLAINKGEVKNTDGTIGALAGGVGFVGVSGPTATWTNTGTLTVGDHGTGTLNVFNGGKVTNGPGEIGYAIGSVGTVTINGAGSTWTNGSSLQIGDSGTGQLTIQNGGKVINTGWSYVGVANGASGIVLVDGTNSIWDNSLGMTVGLNGTASLTVKNGGKVTSTGDRYLGYTAGASGVATLDGAGSTWTGTGDLLVGNAGSGKLTISNGAGVTSGLGEIGVASGSSGDVTVVGTGSTWTNNSALRVGDSGTGKLAIQNGGKVGNGGWAYVGAVAGASGTVLVDGANSTWDNSQGLTIGLAGTASLTISSGGLVKNTDGFIGAVAGSTGMVTVDGAGSKWTNSGDLTVGDAGTGTLDVTHGGAVGSLGGTIGDATGSTGTVNVNGAASKWDTNSGDLRVGNSGIGMLNIANGGQVISGMSSIGWNAASQSSALVDGAGSVWDTASLTVGQSGIGLLNIGNGGRVSSLSGTVGALSGSKGAVAVSDAGSIWHVTNDLIVGDYGQGTLRIDDGAKISVGGELVLANHAGATGGLTIGGAVPGILDATAVRFGAGTGRITFDHTSANYDFSAAISGLGTINQVSGVTHLTADSTGFTGATHIKGGTLLVDGKIGSGAVDVQSGGTLGGKGSIGGTVTVASGGILSGVQGQTLTMQNLNLDGGANVNVTLSSPGGAALFNVANDLTLDGTLNITSGGAFGPGVYSLITYGGTLTDNGLDIGTTPAGSTAGDFGVQTSVAGQVNLVSTALPNLSFWDGDAPGNANNNIVDGGSGTWTATSTNWTDMNGSINGVMHPQPGFAIFQGAAGTVTIDASAGPISVTGMQFATNGYLLTGDPITLADPNSIIRVGDGSAAGANYKATIGSELTGTGGLNKTDLGTLILTADNTYTGGTTIANGTLQLGNGGTSGSVVGNIVNDGLLIFNRSDASTFSGAISGNGSILKEGAGTIDLTGNSGTFIGVVQVDGGTLGIKAGGVLNSSGLFAGGLAGSTGAFVVDGAGSVLNSSSLLALGGDGTGALTVTNGGKVSDSFGVLGVNAGSTGTVTVTGAGSTWTNGTGLLVGVDGAGALNIVNGGSVSSAFAAVGNGSGAQGTVIVDGTGSSWTNSGNLFVGLDGTGTLSIANGATVNAGGAVVLAGQAGSTGTLNIGGAAGSSAKTAGTLNAGTLEFGQGTGTLNFNHTDTNYTFASNMLGSGTINQFSGSTNLTGDSSGFTGAVNVTGGRLAVNGLLGGGQVTVSNGGTLGGNGMIGSLAANAGSIIAPGNSIGTLNIAGNIAFNAGSIYEVEINAAGQSDKIVAGGTATIDGGGVKVLAGSGNYAPATTYTILTATGGRTGTFTDGVTSNLAFLDPSLSYDASNVYLTMTRNNINFAGVGITPNQIATGGGVESLGFGNTIYNAVLNLSASQAQYAFDQLSGEIHASANTVLIEDSRFLRSAVNDRLRAAFGGVGASGGNTVTYDDGKPRAVDPTTDGGAVWGQAFGSWGHWNSDGNAAKLDRSIGGFFMGADASVFDTWRFGAVAGYSRSSFDAEDRHSSGSSDNYSVGLYGGTQWGDLAFRTGAAYTISDIAIKRSVNFTGFANNLSGDYSAGTAQIFGELGNKMQAGSVALEPFANLAYVNLRTDGFTETGGVAALTSPSTVTDTTFTTIGLRAATSFGLNDMVVTAKGMVGWRHAFGDITPTSVMSFAGSAPFSIAGVPIAENAAVVDLGLDMRLSTNTTLGISYGGQFGSGVTDQTLHADFSVTF
ncbi:autotransporter domain-containing protein [Xanthobacter aminoxidans]|uniref:Autotransporter domain-containing protein n=1 Tax=Xanthobacter aminoxidans TaxID=186280 RepID=A0ABW6ZGI8_9HYPH